MENLKLEGDARQWALEKEPLQDCCREWVGTLLCTEEGSRVKTVRLEDGEPIRYLVL